jgi:methyl-accepting chemotaxis protein
MNVLNLKIGTRLGCGFGLILLLLGVVATLGINGMSKSDAALRKMVDVNVKKMVFLEDMETSVHIESRVIRTVALLSDEEEARIQKKKIDAARVVYDTAFSSLEKMPLDEPAKVFVQRRTRRRRRRR